MTRVDAVCWLFFGRTIETNQRSVSDVDVFVLRASVSAAQLKSDACMVQKCRTRLAARAVECPNKTSLA